MAHLKISLGSEQSPTEPDDPPPPYSAQEALLSGSDIASDNAHDRLRQPTLLPSKREHHDEHQASSSSSDAKRTLLLVYIHGFYGNDQSFRSFPAHVHRYLNASSSLSQSHLITSKVYPRYKTYKAIDVARDNFGLWLEPHESPTTDVILVGHSMGGLLAAEVVLQPSDIFQHQYPFKHRILGTISLDAPLLGLHPGIVVSGISSLFRPADASGADAVIGNAESHSHSSSSPYFPGPPRAPMDPTFDPPYFNDAPFREKPLFDRLVNFASKHSNEGLFNALGNHITHHLEFGGCLADYPGLISRYNRLRALEDVDVTSSAQNSAYGATPSRVRVRFVNYYTLCPGRPKPVKSPLLEQSGLSQTDICTTISTHVEPSIKDGDDTQLHIETAKTPAQPSPRASFQSISPLQELEPIPIADDDHPIQQDQTTSPPQDEDHKLSLDTLSLTSTTTIAPLPPLLEKPEAPDFSQYTDKDTRKQAEKEFARREKSYADSLKLRAKTLREREKLLAKQTKQHAKESEKRLKDAKKEAQRLDKEAAKEKHRLEKQEKKEKLEREASSSSSREQKPRKMKKFCTLPTKVNGAMDRTWVSVYMDGVDEVGAHCGLFVPGEHYDKLVEDVGGRIVAWLSEA